MDLKALIAAANKNVHVVNNVPAPPAKPIGVEPVATPVCLVATENCQCGHPQDAHDGNEGDCEILECGCTSYFPPSHLGPVPTPNITIVTPKASITVMIPPQPPDPMEEGNCSHLCDCGDWWSHGDKAKCRYPDVTKQGMCPKCLKGGTASDPLEQVTLKDGKVELTKAYEIEVRNKARESVKDMSIEQLTHHILFNEKRMRELYVTNLEVGKVRRDREEVELETIPEEEREKFRQELRNGASKSKGKTHTTREAKPKKETAKSKDLQIRADLVATGKSPEVAKMLANLMAKYGFDLKQAEAMLDD